MRHGRFVYVLGDVHGDFDDLNDFIHLKIRKDKTLAAIAARWKADGDDLQAMILQCGDFAWYWPRKWKPAIENKVGFLPSGRVPIWWIGGNHEDWDALDALGTQIVEVAKDVFYCPFGTTLRLSPEITVLFAGGAESIDKMARLRHMAGGAPKIWWEQEGISDADLARLANVPRADWVISHTAPEVFDIDDQMRKTGEYVEFHEPSRGMLNAVFEKYKPTRWFFGHFHHYLHGGTDGCKWEGLASIDRGGKVSSKVFLEWEDVANGPPQMRRGGGQFPVAPFFLSDPEAFRQAPRFGA